MELSSEQKEILERFENEERERIEQAIRYLKYPELNLKIAGCRLVDKVFNHEDKKEILTYWVAKHINDSNSILRKEAIQALTRLETRLSLEQMGTLFLLYKVETENEVLKAIDEFLVEDKYSPTFRNFTFAALFLFEIIGESGLTLSLDYLKLFEALPGLREGYVFNSREEPHDTIRSLLRSLVREKVVDFKSVSDGAYRKNAYYITEKGKNLYSLLFDRLTEEPEFKQYERFYDNVKKGYAYETCNEYFVSQGYEVTSTMSGIFSHSYDMIIEKDSFKKYIVLEINDDEPVYRDEETNEFLLLNKISEIYGLSNEFYFIGPSINDLRKLVKKQGKAWISKNFESLEEGNSKVSFYVTSVKKLLKSEPWEKLILI